VEQAGPHAAGVAAIDRTGAESPHVWAGSFEGMRELGHVEGRDFVIEGRYYGDRIDRLPALADEVIR
jgi:hypothetical protein